MVWGCIGIGIGIKPDLVNMSHHVKAAEHQAVVLGRQSEGQTKGQNDVKNWFFIQGGASMHTSLPTIGPIGPYMNTIPGRPPNSPDLNPIEMLWAIIGRRIAGKDFRTAKELADEVKRIWDEAAQESNEGTMESFRSRLELCLACNGASNSQLLSSPGVEPGPQNIADIGWHSCLMGVGRRESVQNECAHVSLWKTVAKSTAVDNNLAEDAAWCACGG
jgi:hypothetical protein